MKNIEDEISNIAAQRMANEIDFEILSGMLCALGWTKIVVKPMTWEDGADIDLWVEQHIKGPVETMGLVWVFQDQQDANWFALRWL